MANNVTTVPILPDAKELSADDLLYLIQGRGSDRDRKVTLEQLFASIPAKDAGVWRTFESTAVHPSIVDLGDWSGNAVINMPAWLSPSGKWMIPTTLRITCQTKNAVILVSADWEKAFDAETGNQQTGSISLSIKKLSDEGYKSFDSVPLRSNFVIGFNTDGEVASISYLPNIKGELITNAITSLGDTQPITVKAPVAFEKDVTLSEDNLGTTITAGNISTRYNRSISGSPFVTLETNENGSHLLVQGVGENVNKLEYNTNGDSFSVGGYAGRVFMNGGTISVDKGYSYSGGNSGTNSTYINKDKDGEDAFGMITLISKNSDTHGLISQYACEISASGIKFYYRDQNGGSWGEPVKSI